MSTDQGHPLVASPAGARPPGLWTPRSGSSSAARWSPPRLSPTISVVMCVLVAAAGGFALGENALLTSIVLVSAVVIALLLSRVEIAACVLVAASLFEGYLSQLNGSTIKALAVVVVGAWAIRRTRGRLHDGRRAPVLFWALGLTVVILVSSIVNLAGAGTAGSLGRWAGFLAVVFVLLDTLRDRLRVETVMAVYVVAAAAAAGCGIATFGSSEDHRVHGPIADPNDFGFFLLVALPLCVALRRRGRRTWPWDLMTLVIAVGLLGTLSRGALLGLAVMLLFAVITRQISLNVLIGLLGVLLTVVGLTASLYPTQVHEAVTAKSAIADQNVSERFYLWHGAEKMILSDPVLGHGPGSFAAQHLSEEDRLPDNINHDLDVAHNTYLEVGAELGVLGLIAFVGLLVAGFAGAWRSWRRSRSPLAAGVTSGVVAAVVAATFISEEFYLPLWLLAALGAALAARGDEYAVPCEPPGPTVEPGREPVPDGGR